MIFALPFKQQLDQSVTLYKHAFTSNENSFNISTTVYIVRRKLNKAVIKLSFVCIGNKTTKTFCFSEKANENLPNHSFWKII